MWWRSFNLAFLSLLISIATAAVRIQPDAQIQVKTDAITKKDKLADVINESPLLKLHRDLVEIQSISSHEFTIGKFVARTLEYHHFDVIKQLVPDPSDSQARRWNIYATPQGHKHRSNGKTVQDSVKPRVILTSHIDTVPPYISYKLSRSHGSKKREDILISGRGTVDDKACVAAQIQAALDLLESGDLADPRDIALLFVVSEETNGSGMKFFSGSKLYQSIQDHVEAVIFGEPTEAKLASGHKGITMAHIQAKGKAAHSGYPWLGKSANSMIIPALMVLDKLGELLPEEGGLPRSDEFGNSTVNVGWMSGGVAANVVPAHAEAKVSFRLAGGTAESVQQIVLNAVRGADPRSELEVEFTQGYGPVPLDSDVEGFESLVVNYGTDVPNLQVAQGVKRYLYGPGTIQVAHGDDEGLTVGELEQAAKDYVRLVKHVLGS